MIKKNNLEATTYQIRIKGHLPGMWSEWFDGFAIENTVQGETQMTGEVIDQTALHSLLQRIRDMGITLIEVKRLEKEEESEES